MQRSQIEQQLRALAARLGRFAPRTDEDISSCGLMAGALYALIKASELGFDDARVVPDPGAMAGEFQITLDALGKGAPPPSAWVAGFYLNSAMMRLAALNERLDRPADLARPVRKAVNVLKHEPDSHISGRGGMSLGDVVDSAHRLVALLESRLGPTLRDHSQDE